MVEYSYELKIPKDRVAVLIGKNGEIKKQLEEHTKTKIKVDSEEGDVFVMGEDAILLFSVREIIKAISCIKSKGPESFRSLRGVKQKARVYSAKGR